MSRSKTASRSETAKLWRKRLRRFAGSQMTVAQFCRSEDVSLATYYYWKKKLRGQPVTSTLVTSKPSAAKPSAATPKKSNTEVQFMPLRLAADLATQGVPEADAQTASALVCTTIELPGGIRIRVEAPTEPTVRDVRPMADQPGEERR